MTLGPFARPVTRPIRTPGAAPAWNALVTQGSLKAGDFVVVQGTGGVSIFALQFAAAFGARAIVLSSSNDKLERAKSLGAFGLINYKEKPEWAKEVKALTGSGADHVVEVGGSGTLNQSVRALRSGGTVSSIGVLSGAAGEVDLRPIFMRNIRLQGVFVGTRDEFESMNRAISHKRIKPVVDKVFPMAEIRTALEHMADGKHFGKVCISLE